ncbi:MFS transporter [Campylobacter subantarcticus]|uniref:Major facilitator superfamily transporter n=1 Tax=Campylobacter subantarcticus LMG 24374 TaxID=1388751 RepID=A0A0A8H9X3_9BACT|nr:MFS transporter [Campylobacter subantarcticus]AJC90923.1 major facilitator superfamily transporter [Campylobacter subantarcticus LMG 24374]EAJ1260405.1 MFS transporter [Campylobacter lari]
MGQSENHGLKNNFFTLLLLSFCGSIIYGLPYFRKYYYDDYMNLYHLNNFEMGLLGSAYGLLGLFSYALGGYLADRFAPKKLLIFSLVATGLGGLLHLYFTSLNALLVIYGLWGITSLLTFWPSLMKIVRSLASSKEQARAYGIFEGGRGVVGAAHLAIATSIFGYFQTQALANKGIEMIIIFYSLAPIVSAVILFFLLEDKIEEASEKLRLQDLIFLLKNSALWLVVAITFCTYFFNMSFYYFTPYASNVIGTSAVFAAILTVLAQYIRPISSVIGGFIADGYGKAKVMMIGFILMGIGVVFLILSSYTSGFLQMSILTSACVVIYVAMYSNFGIYYSLLSEGKIPIHLAGMAIGIVSTFGYLPEVFAPLLAGDLLDRYPGVKGFYIYFSIMITMAFLGVMFCLIWIKKYNKKERI